jgi:drug/metabolite transporter (DMT)-like permease
MIREKKNSAPAVQRKLHLDGLAVGLLIVCSAFWGFQQVLVKATIVEIAPVFQAAMRFGAATVLLVLWCRWRGVALLGRDQSLWPGLLAGSLFAIEFACLYIGLQYSAASRLTVFLYTAPFWVAVLLPFWVHSERLRRLQWLGLALAFVAVLFALRDGLVQAVNPKQWLGDLMALAAGLAWGLTTVTIRTTRLTLISPEKLLFYQIGVSAALMPVLSLLLGERWHLQFSGFAITSLLLQTVVGAFASYLAWMWMLGRYPATRISVFAFLTPVFALLFGALWLGEPVTAALLASLALVAVGIVLVNSKPGR